MPLNIWGNFRRFCACSQGRDKCNHPKVVKLHFSVEGDFWAEDGKMGEDRKQVFYPENSAKYLVSGPNRGL